MTRRITLRNLRHPKRRVTGQRIGFVDGFFVVRVDGAELNELLPAKVWEEVF